MRRYGISVYPEYSKLKDNLDYITLAGEMGYSRIFTCLLSVPSDKEKIKEEFRTIMDHAHKYSMEVICDVAPSVFESLGISYKDLSFFNEIGADGIRLDMGFTGNEESLMTYNPYGLDIELNISSGTRYLENIMSYKADPHRLLGCHNFYPKMRTGLTKELLIETSLPYKSFAITTAAFVNAPSATFGPWPLVDGLCTLEEHRSLPIDVQAKDLFYTGVIDDVLIANAFASEKDLKDLKSVDGGLITLDVELEYELSSVENAIIFDELHFYRGDINAYTIRSTQPRVKYKGHPIAVRNTRSIKRGDVMLQNEDIIRYNGELHIALQDMDNDGTMNVVGRVSETNMRFIDNIGPWSKFRLKNRTV